MKTILQYETDLEQGSEAGDMSSWWALLQHQLRYGCKCSSCGEQFNRDNLHANDRFGKLCSACFSIQEWVVKVATA